MAKQGTGLARYSIVCADGKRIAITVRGRDRWALESLINSGQVGCTPIANPAPRWSAYIHNLRGLGVPVETLHEPHGGAFPGTHGRYVLRCTVERLDHGGDE